MNSGTWTNGKKTVKGFWEYLWASDRFYIELNTKDRITGLQRCFCTSNDTPEWGNWKLQRPKGATDGK